MLENHELAEAYDESGNSAERANPNHDLKSGKFTTGSGGGGSGSGGGTSGGKKKTKYSPSPRRNPNGITINPKKYAKLTGVMSTKYPNAKAGDYLSITDANHSYLVIADGYGGMKIVRRTKIK